MQTLFSGELSPILLKKHRKPDICIKSKKLKQLLKIDKNKNATSELKS